MSRVVKIQGNYTVISTNGTISLNPGTGNVIVNGNIDVKGTMTTIESSNTTIKDNIIQLNYGELGNGISLGTAGIEVERGPSTPAAQWLFNESIPFYNPQTQTNTYGSWQATLAGGGFAGVTAANYGVATGYDFLISLNNTTNLVRVVNQNSYASSINYTFNQNLNALVSKDWVQHYVSAYQGNAQVDRFYYTPDNNVTINSIGRAWSDHIDLTVNGAVRLTANATGVTVDNLNVYNNTLSTGTATYSVQMTQTTAPNLITMSAATGLAVGAQIVFSGSPYGGITAGTVYYITSVSGVNITISTSPGGTNLTVTSNSGYINATVTSNLLLVSASGNVEVNGVLNIDDTTTSPTTTTGLTKIYSKSTSAGPGKSGIFFTNTTTSDELVSKNRAVLLSILL